VLQMLFQEIYHFNKVYHPPFPFPPFYLFISPVPPPYTNHLYLDQPGMSTSEQGKSIWDPITEHLLAAKRRARANALAQANEPPEDVWRRRSELIISELRLTGMSGIATRSVTAQAKKMRGAAAYDAAGTNEAEVPFVASGGSCFLGASTVI
jgi:hypothetical protein